MTKPPIPDLNIDSIVASAERAWKLWDRVDDETKKAYFLTIYSAVVSMAGQIKQYEDVMADLMRDSGSWLQDALPPSRLRERNGELKEGLRELTQTVFYFIAGQRSQQELSEAMVDADKLVFKEKQDE